MAIRTEVSVGEFLDKLTILEIKSERIRDAAPLANVRRELDALRAAWASSPYAAADVAADRAALKRVNEVLWELEDRLREKEGLGSFDGEFVELARGVYRTNDERAAIKRRINLRLGSSLIEEKSHPTY
jgi:hypothetical protein